MGTKKSGNKPSAKVNGSGLVLTPAMRKMAEMLADPESERKTITEMCENIGIDRSTYYKHWKDNPRFREYLNELIEKYTDSELSAVWRALIGRCLSGDVGAMKLFFEMKGRYRQQIDINGGVTFISGEDEVAE